MITQYAPYISINNWTSHQRVDKPTASRIPAPPISPRTVANDREPDKNAPEPSPPPRASRARADRSTGEDQKESKEPPYPPTAQPNGHASSAGGDEEPAQSIWTADELQQRTVEILTWWAALSGKDLRDLSGQQAKLTQERAITVARKSYEVVDMCAAAEAWYSEQHDKPEQLYSPLMYPLFEQGGSAAIKKRKPHGLVRALTHPDPDDEPPDAARQPTRTREANSAASLLAGAEPGEDLKA